MDRVVQEIIKRYREYKKKIGSSIPIPTVPMPVALILVFSTVLTASFPSHAADQLIPYYGKEFYDRLRSGERDSALIEDLREILTSRHLRRDGDFDEVGANCDSANRNCYDHSPIGYNAARKVLMGQLHLENANGNYVIHDVYCEKDFSDRDFPSGAGPHPDSAPSDKVVNVEHTWPQSRFNSSMNKGAQKSDLHHLFPADSKLNGIRGNLKFGEVDQPAYALKCPQSKMGRISGKNGDFFEPPNGHKGNVARALFYFSVRYKISIDPTEEAFLRKWNEQDPVDQFERDRNDAIQKIQGNRNPFVDFPNLANAIRDF